MLKAIDEALQTAVNESERDAILAAILVVDGKSARNATADLLKLIENVHQRCGKLPNSTIFFSELGMIAVTGNATVMQTFLDQPEVIAAKATDEGNIPSNKEVARLAVEYRRKPLANWVMLGLTSSSVILLIGALLLLYLWRNSQNQIEKMEYQNSVSQQQLSEMDRQSETLNRRIRELKHDVAFLDSPAYAMLSLTSSIKPPYSDHLEVDWKLIDLAKEAGATPRSVAYELALSVDRLDGHGISVDSLDFLQAVANLKFNRRGDFTKFLGSYEEARLAGETHEVAMKAGSTKIQEE